MPINSNPWYVIDRLDTVMFGHGGESKESKEVWQLLISTSAKWAHTGNLTPADIYNNVEISIQILSIDHTQIGSSLLHMMARSHL